jgi:hypothetical protein
VPNLGHTCGEMLAKNRRVGTCHDHRRFVASSSSAESDAGIAV